MKISTFLLKIMEFLLIDNVLRTDIWEAMSFPNTRAQAYNRTPALDALVYSGISRPELKRMVVESRF